MSNDSNDEFPLPPLIYPPPVPSEASRNHDAESGLQENKSLYLWELKDIYPPHVAQVPGGDNQSQFQIFNVQALLQVGGMLLPDSEISKDYLRLAPDPNVPVSLEDLVIHNQSQRAPPGVSNNMFFRFNIGDRRKKDWYSDAVFAQQHFTGTNATTITLAGDWITAFKQYAKDHNHEMWSVIDRTSPKSLYVQDYSYFRHAMGLGDEKTFIPRNDPDPASAPESAPEITSGNGRYGCAPVALFRLEDEGQLHPLAIVIDYKGSLKDSIVIFNTRLTSGSTDLTNESQDWPWRYAKMCVQSADWLRHEVTIHLVNTHFVEEASIVAAHRTIPPHHIVFQLLQKHWETTLSLNQAGRATLFPQVISQLAGVEQGCLVKFVNHAYTSFDWSRLRIPNDLEARGFPVADLKDSDKFHRYAYGRNMALMWPAIRAFVARILGPCYHDRDENVAGDPYIQDFCKEMRSSEGGNMSTFPEIKTLDELIDTVTMCIHIASPQHTAVNYLQHYYQVFVPNKPWALYTPLPQSLDQLQAYKEQNILDALPFKKTKDWLLGTQLPYLLSFEVIGQSSLLSYAENQSASKIKVVADSARLFKTELGSLQVAFENHSDALKDPDTNYMVMDPCITAVSILI